MGWTNPPSSGGGPFGGVNPPAFQTGKLYWPHHLMIPKNGSFAITANRLYRTWFYVPATTTFLGGWTYNALLTDTGAVIRMGVWTAAGTLKKDFGVITLDNTSALRLDANSVTLGGPAWYQIGMVSSGTPGLYGLDVGRPGGGTADDSTFVNPLTIQMGMFNAALVIGTGSGFANMPVGDYAAFNYAAMPDPITTATATIVGTSSVSAPTFPLMGLYL